MFALRIDIDSLKGLREGVPKLLDTLSKYDMKASFFSVMGWEGDFLSTVKYRIIRAKAHTPSTDFVGRLGSTDKQSSLKLTKFVSGYSELLRCLFFPVKFSHEKDILYMIKEEGHELGVHGYVHVKWHNLKKNEAEKEFQQMTSSYEKLFGERPKGFASPRFISNNTVRELTEKHGFKYSSLTYGEKPFFPVLNGQLCSHVEIPVTIDMIDDKGLIVPILYYFSRTGLSDSKIVEEATKRIDEKLRANKLASMYIHPKDEGRYLQPLFEKVIKHVHDWGCEVKTFEEIAVEYTKQAKGEEIGNHS